MYKKRLHQYAVFTAACTFCLIFIGGLVTSTGSGLSVPDWPTTYGQNMFLFPLHKWIGGIKYEHGHRLFASFVGFLTVVLAVWIAVKEDRLWMKWFGFAAVGAVILQGVLGGLTVLFLLPTPISVAHGMLAQTFFCIVSLIALFTSKWWNDIESIPLNKRGKLLQILMVSATVAVFIQLGLGAWMRHSYSGLAVPDFPLAFGQIFPTLSADALQKYNQQLIAEGIKWPGDAPIVGYQILIHMLHRTWAYIVAIIVFTAGFQTYRSAFLPKIIRRAGIGLMIAIIIQFTLGIMTVLTRKQVIITTAHVTLGAFTLVLCVLTTVMISKMFNFHLSTR